MALEMGTAKVAVPKVSKDPNFQVTILRILSMSGMLKMALPSVP